MATVTIEVPAHTPPLVQAFLDAGYSVAEADRIVNLLIDFELNRLHPKADRES